MDGVEGVWRDAQHVQFAEVSGGIIKLVQFEISRRYLSYLREIVQISFEMSQFEQ